MEIGEDYERLVARALVDRFGWALEDALAWTAQRRGTLSAHRASGSTPEACAWALRRERSERFTSDMGEG